MSKHSKDIIQSLPITTKIEEKEIKPESQITLNCWNCNKDVLIQKEWKLVQCTICSKVNRVPGSGIYDENHNVNEEIKGKATFKDMKPDGFEFDIQFPVSHSIVSCPFCKSENKISHYLKL